MMLRAYSGLNRHRNLTDDNPQRIKRVDPETAKQLNYEGIELPVRIKDIPKIENMNEISGFS